MSSSLTLTEPRLKLINFWDSGLAPQHCPSLPFPCVIIAMELSCCVTQSELLSQEPLGGFPHMRHSFVISDCAWQVKEVKPYTEFYLIPKT